MKFTEIYITKPDPTTGAQYSIYNQYNAIKYKNSVHHWEYCRNACATVHMLQNIAQWHLWTQRMETVPGDLEWMNSEGHEDKEPIL